MEDPIIYRGYENVGIKPASGEDKWGELGDIFAVTFHHSAGPRAYNKERAKALHKAYQKQHIDQNYGDIGYHFSMDDEGRFYALRDIRYKGAHVGGGNTGNIGIMVHGNYMYDKLYDKQIDSFRWLFRGGFNKLFGATEDEIVLVRGHKEWQGHSTNACPGDNLMRHLIYRRNTETY